MAFFIKTLDNEEHTFDLSDIGDNVSEESLKEFIGKKLRLTFFSISQYDLLMDGSVVEITNPCKDISNGEKEEYFEFLDSYGLDNDVYKFSSYFGHLECLKYAYENRHKDLPGCLQYFKKDLEWNKWTCMSVAKNGHLNCLEYAFKNGCEWDKWTCESAAKNGHLNCLKYAHENGCEWDKWTCYLAAENNNLDYLKYAYEHDCRWDRDTCSGSETNGNVDCLKHICENGCGINKRMLKNIQKYTHILEYIKSLN